MKKIRITMNDGSKWEVPASVVAKNRATYYTEKDKDVTYQEEYDYTMSEDDELLDWAANNMNWEDVEKSAIRVSVADIDFQEGWVNGEKEIIND